MASSLANAVSKIKSAIGNAASAVNSAANSSASKTTGATSSPKQTAVTTKSNAGTPTNVTKKSLLASTLTSGANKTTTQTPTATKTSAVTKKGAAGIGNTLANMANTLVNTAKANQAKTDPYVKSEWTTPSGQKRTVRTQPTGVTGPLDVPKTDNTWKSSSGKTLAELEGEYQDSFRALDSFLQTSQKGIRGFLNGDNRKENELAKAMDTARTAYEDAKKEKSFYDRAMGYSTYDSAALGKEWEELTGMSQYDDENIDTYQQIIDSLKSKKSLINPGYATTTSEYEQQKKELAEIDKEIAYYEDMKSASEKTKASKRDNATEGLAAITALMQSKDYIGQKYGKGNRWEKYKELEAAAKAETDPSKKAILTMDMALMKNGAEYDKYLYYDTAGAEKQLADIKEKQIELDDEVTMLRSDMSAIDSGRETESGLTAQQIRLRLEQIESEAAMMQEQTQAIRADMTGAKSVQKLDPYYHLPEEEDFEKYVEQGEAIKNDPVSATGLTKSKFARLANPAKYVRDMYADVLANGDNLPDDVAAANQSYNYMTEEEYQTYEYLLGKYGKARAEQYHLDMLEVLNSRQGQQMAEDVAASNPAIQVLAAPAMAAATGIEQYATGWQNTIRALQGNDPVDTSANQFFAANYREKLGDVGNPIFENGTTAAQMLWDSGVTIANMAPSILVGQAAGALGAGLPAWAGSAISKLGTATMGISAGGNYYAEAIRNGYNKEEAGKYAALAGASEAVLQDVLGGISHLGGIIPEGISNTVLANIDNAYMRMAAEIAVRDFGEGVEEYLQDVLTPVFYNIAAGEKNTAKLFNNPEATYSFLMACLTTTLLEGSDVYNGTVQASKVGEAYNKFFSPTSDIFEIASQWDGEIGDLAEGIMYGDIKMNDANLGKVLQEFAARGEGKEIQKALTEAIVKATPEDFAQIYASLENPEAFTLKDEAAFILNNSAGKDVEYSNQQLTLLTTLAKLGKLSEAGWKKLDVTNPAVQQVFATKTGARFTPDMSAEAARNVFEAAAADARARVERESAAVEAAKVDSEAVMDRIKSRRAVLERATKTASELASEPAGEAAPSVVPEAPVAKTEAVKPKVAPAVETTTEETPAEEVAKKELDMEARRASIRRQAAAARAEAEAAPVETEEADMETKRKAIRRQAAAAKAETTTEEAPAKVEAPKPVAEKAAPVETTKAEAQDQKAEVVKPKRKKAKKTVEKATDTATSETTETAKPAVEKARAAVTSAPVETAKAEPTVTEAPATEAVAETPATPEWYNESMGDLNDTLTYRSGKGITRQQWVERGINKFGKTAEEANAEFNQRLANNAPAPASTTTEPTVAEAPVETTEAQLKAGQPIPNKRTQKIVNKFNKDASSVSDQELHDALDYLMEHGATEGENPHHDLFVRMDNEMSNREDAASHANEAALTAEGEADTIRPISQDIQSTIDKFNQDTSYPTDQELRNAIDTLQDAVAGDRNNPQFEILDQMTEELALREQEAQDAAGLLATFRRDPGELSEQDAVWLFEYALNHDGFDDVIDDLEQNVRDWGYDFYADRVKREAQERLSALRRTEPLRSGDGGRNSLGSTGDVGSVTGRPAGNGGVQEADRLGLNNQPNGQGTLGQRGTNGRGKTQTSARLKPGKQLFSDTYLPEGVEQLDEPAARAAIGGMLYDTLKRTGLNIVAAETLCDKKGGRVPGTTAFGPDGTTIYVSTNHPQFSAAGIAIHEAVHRWMQRAFGDQHLDKAKAIASQVLIDAGISADTILDLVDAYKAVYSKSYAKIKEENEALFNSMIWEEILGDMVGSAPYSFVEKLGLYNRGISDLARNALRDERVIEQAMAAAGIANPTARYYTRETLSGDRFNEQDLYGWTDEMLGSLYKAEETDDGLSPFITDAERFLNDPKSKLQNVFNKLGEAKADNLAAQLRKLVKPQEMQWTGLNYFFDEHKGQLVTKQDVLDYIEKNNIQIGQNTYRAPGDDATTELMDTDTGEIYDDLDAAKENIAYTLSTRPGVYGLRASEIGDAIYANDLLDSETANGSTLIEIETLDGNFEPVVVVRPLSDTGTARWGGPTPQGGYGNYALGGGENYREYTYKYQNRDAEPYTNQSMELHFDDTDLLGHARVQDFTTPDGKKVLFVEEVQSDWASALRKNGMDVEQPLLMELAQQIEELQEQASHLRNQAFGPNGRRTEIMLGEEYVQKLKDRYYDMLGQIRELKNKRDIEKVVSRGYQIVPNGNEFMVLDKHGDPVTEKVIEGDDVVNGPPITRPSEAEAAKAAISFEDIGDPAPNMPFGGDYYQFVLKDLLKKAVDGEYDYIAWATPEMQSERYYNGSDAKARQYQEYKYDFRTPQELAEAGEKKPQAGPIQSFLNKYSNANRWIPEFQTITLENAKPDPGHKMRITEVPSMAISEAMANSLNENPQPLFKAEDTEAAESVGLDLNEAFPEGSFERTLLKMMRSGNTEAAQAYVNGIINSEPTYTETPSATENLPVTDEELATLREAQEEKIRRYGKLKPGEKAARDIRIAEKQNDDTFTRRHAARVAEAESVPEHTARALEKFIATDEAASYVRITDKEATNYADNLVKKMGIDKAMKVWDGLSSPMHNPTKKDIALGETLALWAAHNGRDDLAMKIWADIDVMATNAGQVVQSMRLVKKMSPEYQAYYVRKVVDQLNHNYAKQIDKGWKGMTEITINKDLEDAVLNASTKEELDTAMDALLTDLARQIPASAKEKWDSWRYFAMLGNPRTHVRNILGNALFAPLIFGKNLLADMGENIAVSLGAMDESQRTKSMTGRAQYRDFAEKDFEQMENEITGERDKYTNPRDAIMAKRNTWRFTPMEKATKFVGDALNAEDAWFLKPYYTHALEGFLAARHANIEELQSTPEGRKMLNEARAYAVREAQKATYRDASVVAQALNKLKKVPGLGLFVNGVLPFTGTPVNILRRGLEYSPVGLLKTLTYNTAQLAKGKIDPAQYIDNLASGMTGSMVAALGLWLASAGLLRGVNDDDDKKKADFEKNQGRQNYSLEFDIGGKNYSYTVDWMAPTSLPLFVGVALHDLLAKDNKMSYGDWIQAMSVIVDPMTNLSMLDGLNKTLSSLSYAEDDEMLSTLLQEMGTSYLGQAIPTLWGQIARTFDGTRRSSYADKNSDIPKWIQYFIQSSVQNKIPVWEGEKMAYVDLWGRKDTEESMTLRAIENFISPGYLNEITVTPVDEELQRLYDATGENSILPSKSSKYFSVEGERKDLTAQEFEQLCTEAGQTKFDLLGELFNDQRYADAPEAVKMQMVEDMYKYANAVAKFHLADGYNIHNQGVWIETAEASDNPYESIMENRYTKHMNDFAKGGGELPATTEGEAPAATAAEAPVAPAPTQTSTEIGKQASGFAGQLDAFSAAINKAITDQTSQIAASAPAPANLTDNDRKAYNAHAKAAGVSEDTYLKAITESNKDDNANIKQEELGSYLNKQIREGKLSETQASAIWDSYSSSKQTPWKTSYSGWKAKGNNVSKSVRLDEDEEEDTETQELRQMEYEEYLANNPNSNVSFDDWDEYISRGWEVPKQGGVYDIVPYATKALQEKFGEYLKSEGVQPYDTGYPNYLYPDINDWNGTLDEYKAEVERRKKFEKDRMGFEELPTFPVDELYAAWQEDPDAKDISFTDYINLPENKEWMQEIAGGMSSPEWTPLTGSNARTYKGTSKKAQRRVAPVAQNAASIAKALRKAGISR